MFWGIDARTKWQHFKQITKFYLTTGCIILEDVDTASMFVSCGRFSCVIWYIRTLTWNLHHEHTHTQSSQIPKESSVNCLRWANNSFTRYVPTWDHKILHNGFGLSKWYPSNPCLIIVKYDHFTIQNLCNASRKCLTKRAMQKNMNQKTQIHTIVYKNTVSVACTHIRTYTHLVVGKFNNCNNNDKQMYHVSTFTRSL